MFPLIFCTIYFIAFIWKFLRLLLLSSLLFTRDSLHNDVEKLREEQRYTEMDISSIQMRWHSLREEKLRATNTLNELRKVEEELDRLAEQKNQAELDEKVTG